MLVFQTSSPESRLGAAIYLSERIYHASVRKVRQKHGNALLSILVTIGQTALFTLAFYIMFAILPIRAASIRGDFFIYTMSGVFLFMAHIQTVKAISASEKSTSAMMQHAPMNTAIAITASALSELYTQLMAGSVLLFGYYVAISPFEIKEPITCVGMVILAWMSGIAVGLVFMAAKPWAPGPIGLLSLVYQRANMVASGKMFVANSLPPFMLSMFDWNPLFHIIDQTRGFAFVNYTPHNSSFFYPIYMTLAFLLIGLMIEFVTRKYASASWSARG
jgi:ABC-type polysaccharide/polyol phosphate export permease